MTKQDINDLINLIEHARRDMGYGSGGSYVDENDSNFEKIDKKAVKSSERAINIIKKIILTDM